jgi:serine/threonine protein kinase
VTQPQGFDDLFDRVADGRPIDWEAAEQQAATPEQRAVLRQLRLISDVGAMPADAGNTTPFDEDVTRLVPSTAPTTAGTNLAGTKWGKFLLLELIGQGGFGVVYRARDEQLDREVAIKLLHPRLVTREDVKAEGRALARVEHPNVLTIYGVEEHNGQLGLCMKYIRGRTLEEIIKKDGPMNAEEALVVARSICGAVAAVHHAGVLHRDIKARNIMRERNGRFVLMDFGAGITRDAANGSRGEQTIGTPLWMAPELFDGRPASRQTDVYALGILLYYLVTGDYPVSGGSKDEIIHAHRTKQRVGLDDRRLDLPPAYVRAVERATASNPAQRPESANALLRELALPPATPLQHEEPEKVDWRVRVGQATYSAALLALLSLASGMLSARLFNRIIDRSSAFDATTAMVIWRTGFKAVVLPMMVVIVLGGLVAAVQFATSIAPGLRGLWNRLWLGLAQRLGLAAGDHGRAVAGAAILLGLIGFSLVWVSSNSVIVGFLSFLASDDLRRFEPFTPGNDIPALQYRVSIVAVIFVSVLVWLKGQKIAAANGSRIPTSLTAAGFGVLTLLMVFVQAPYYLMTTDHNQVAVVIVGDQRCHLLGASGDESLVHCAAWPAPRVRNIPTSTIERRCNFDENIFVQPAAPGCERTASPPDRAP